MNPSFSCAASSRGCRNYQVRVRLGSSSLSPGCFVLSCRPDTRRRRVLSETRRRSLPRRLPHAVYFVTFQVLSEGQSHNIKRSTLTADINIHSRANLRELTVHQCHSNREAQSRGRNTGGTSPISLPSSPPAWSRHEQDALPGLQTHQDALRPRTLPARTVPRGPTKSEAFFSSAISTQAAQAGLKG